MTNRRPISLDDLSRLVAERNERERRAQQPARIPEPRSPGRARPRRYLTGRRKTGGGHQE